MSLFSVNIGGACFVRLVYNSRKSLLQHFWPITLYPLSNSGQSQISTTAELTGHLPLIFFFRVGGRNLIKQFCPPCSTFPLLPPPLSPSLIYRLAPLCFHFQRCRLISQAESVSKAEHTEHLSCGSVKEQTKLEFPNQLLIELPLATAL